MKRYIEVIIILFSTTKKGSFEVTDPALTLPCNGLDTDSILVPSTNTVSTLSVEVKDASAARIQLPSSGAITQGEVTCRSENLVHVQNYARDTENCCT